MKLIAEFEVSAIHYTPLGIDEGYFGSNPKNISKCLSAYNINSSEISSMHPIPWRINQSDKVKQLDKALKEGKIVIFSAWWYVNGLIDVQKGLHTVAIKQASNGNIDIYNLAGYEWEPDNTFSSITDLFDKNEFQTLVTGIIV